MKKYSNYLICFDLDGTLINSMAIENDLFFDIVDENLELPTKEPRKDIKAMALPAEERFDFFWKDEIKEKEISEDEIQDVIKEYYKRVMDIKIPLLPNAIETVKLMSDNFEFMALVSSNNTSTIEETLKVIGIRDLFVKISGIDDIEFSKPNPEIYSKTVDYFGVDSQKALTFEDSTYGITSAKGAGMKVIAVATGLETKEELQKTPADIVLNDLSGVTIEMIKEVLNISS